jgi:hypothetical protein
MRNRRFSDTLPLHKLILEGEQHMAVRSLPKRMAKMFRDTVKSFMKTIVVTEALR